MSKAVLISIQPKWCELIASGRKTIKVQKTKPKIPTPFKCYIYETKAIYKPSGSPCLFQGIGKVIGEFVCYRIDTYDDDTIHSFSHEDYCSWNDFELNRSCIHPEDFESYANGKWLYGWHISNLKIYDKPKELSEFNTICNRSGNTEDRICKSCPHFCFDDNPIGGYTRWCGVFKKKPITRPPQSWCYVERLVGEQ